MPEAPGIADPQAHSIAESKAIRAADAVPARSWKAFRGLVWAEWFTHSKMLLVFFTAWLAAVWLLPLVTHPGWILVIGGVYAIIAGPAFGGSDVLHGCEEFSFALPATRSDRYLARIVVGVGSLLFLTAINLLALGLDLPYVLGRLYIETGLIKAAPVLRPRLLYGLVAALPVAVFAFGFAVAAVSHSRVVILTSWFWACVASLAVLQLGFWYEELIWDSFTGFFSFPLLVAAGAGGLAVGALLYSRKEVGEAAAPLTMPGRWWLWIVVFLLGLVLALALISSLMRQYPKFLVPIA